LINDTAEMPRAPKPAKKQNKKQATFEQSKNFHLEPPKTLIF